MDEKKLDDLRKSLYANAGVEASAESEAEVPELAGKPINHAKGRRKHPSEKRSYVKAEEAYKRLDKLRRFADNGASMRWLAGQAGVSDLAVMRWFRDRGITRGSAAQRELKVLDALGLATSNRDVLQRAEASPFRGAWNDPQFVLRQPLHYDTFVACVHALAHNIGLNAATIASALGMDETSIHEALAAQERFLNSQATLRCKSCGDPMDPLFVPTGFCSAQCERLYPRLKR